MSDREYESCKVVKQEYITTAVIKLELTTAHGISGEYVMTKEEATELAIQLLNAAVYLQS